MYPRSYLFVPGNRPERFDKACAAGADAVVLDLEDAVPSTAKAQARDAVVSWLGKGGRAYVRANAVGTAWYQDDIAALRTCPSLQGIVVPKAERADLLSNLANEISDEAVLLPLIETAVAFDDLRSLAKAPKVARLLFGTLDFQVDTGIQGDGDELVYFRSQLTIASRIAASRPRWTESLLQSMTLSGSAATRFEPAISVSGASCASTQNRSSMYTRLCALVRKSSRGRDESLLPFRKATARPLASMEKWWTLLSLRKRTTS